MRAAATRAGVIALLWLTLTATDVPKLTAASGALALLISGALGFCVVVAYRDARLRARRMNRAVR